MFVCAALTLMLSKTQELSRSSVDAAPLLQSYPSPFTEGSYGPTDDRYLYTDISTQISLFITMVITHRMRNSLSLNFMSRASIVFSSSLL